MRLQGVLERVFQFLIAGEPALLAEPQNRSGRHARIFRQFPDRHVDDERFVLGNAFIDFEVRRVEVADCFCVEDGEDLLCFRYLGFVCVGCYADNQCDKRMLSASITAQFLMVSQTHRSLN